jgi:hypothetical protein
MDILAKLEQLKAQGNKVVSIEFMIKELRGIPPTHAYTPSDSPRAYINMNKEQIDAVRLNA